MCSVAARLLRSSHYYLFVCHGISSLVIPVVHTFNSHYVSYLRPSSLIHMPLSDSNSALSSTCIPFTFTSPNSHDYHERLPIITNMTFHDIPLYISSCRSHINPHSDHPRTVSSLARIVLYPSLHLYRPPSHPHRIAVAHLLSIPHLCCCLRRPARSRSCTLSQAITIECRHYHASIALRVGPNCTASN